MDANKVNNAELAKYLENHPEATHKEVIEFCKEKIVTELKEFLDRDIEKTHLDYDLGYKRKIEDAIVYRNGMRNHERLADDAMETYNGIVRQAEEVIALHKDELFAKLKYEVEVALGDLAEMNPKAAPNVPKGFGEATKSAQDDVDKGRTGYLEAMAQEGKQELLKTFARMDPTPDRIDDLKYILRKSDGVLEFELFDLLKGQTNRTLDGLDMICSKYMKMVEEAIYETALENGEEEKEEQVETLEEEDEIPNIFDTDPEKAKKAEEYWAKKRAESEAEKNKEVKLEQINYYDVEPAVPEEHVVEEPIPEEPAKEDLTVEETKKMDPKVAEIAIYLEKFRLLAEEKMTEGFDPKEALAEAQNLLIQEAQREVEQEKAEKQEKSGLEDVMNDPNVRSSEVKDTIQVVKQEREETKSKPLNEMTPEEIADLFR